ncbi:MAG: hypothetical protein IJG45_00930 [Oscillospiraceae bacterium]|nr:hypothetical protein [Oscillospiraceae bacterium]
MKTRKIRWIKNGIQEVSGSIPLISTKENSHPKGWLFFFGAVGLGTGRPVRTQGFLLRSKSDAERRNAAGGQIRSVTEALCAGVSRLSPPPANPCKHYVCKDFCFFIQEAETRFIWNLYGICME